MIHHHSQEQAEELTWGCSLPYLGYTHLYNEVLDRFARFGTVVVSIRRDRRGRPFAIVQYEVSFDITSRE